MKETSDELIQRAVEESQPAQGPDADSYRLVFTALKKNPELSLPAGFAERVAGLAPSRIRAFNWDKFFLVSGCASFLCALAYAVVSISPSFSTGVFSFVSGYPGLVAFAVMFVLILNWIDKKWIAKSRTI
jgi:hypothetical protein